MGIDPIAMTNAMATGGLSFDGTAMWLTLLGLLVGSAASLLFAGIETRWRSTPRPRLRPVEASAAGAK